MFISSLYRPKQPSKKNYGWSQFNLYTSIATIYIITNSYAPFYQTTIEIINRIFKFNFNYEKSTYSPLNVNLPHMLCLMISVSSVSEPLSTAQLRTVKCLVVSLAEIVGIWNLEARISFNSPTIISRHFYASWGRKQSILKLVSFVSEKQILVSKFYLLLCDLHSKPNFSSCHTGIFIELFILKSIV